MELGMYMNPLWVNTGALEKGYKIKGTDIPIANIADKSENATWFTWV